MSCALPSRLLRAALAADAAASGAIALMFFLVPHLAARSFGMPVELLIGSSVLLGAYTAALIWLASSATVARALVLLVVAGNLLRAAGCLALLAAFRSELTPLGIVVLLAQAVGMLACAGAQALGLGQSRTMSRTGASLVWKSTL